MRCLIEPRDRRNVKGYGFVSFAKYIGKTLSNKYSQKVLDIAKTSTTDTLKSASKGAIQKTAEAAGDLTGNKIADKIRSKAKTDKNELQIPKKRYISPQKDKKLLIN